MKEINLDFVSNELEKVSPKYKRVNTWFKKNHVAQKVNNFIILGTLASCARSTPSQSVIDVYAQTVKNDNLLRVSEFTTVASEDLSGNSYSACIVDSNCLSGVEICVPGTKANTIQEPGYCVPKTNK